MICIDTEGACSSFVSTLKILCANNNYTFKPNNKRYYLVDNISRECIGVDNSGGHKVVTHGVSYIELREIFAK